MTALLFTAPVFRPLSITGAIMPNAYVQFYESGSTTPADIYADADLDTPLTNPVEADSDGVFPPIYLDRSVAYRAQLYDADDVLVWDIDPLGTPLDFQPGTVIMFFGDATERDAAYPPALWAVCDGTSGTPNLVGRFPMGVDTGLAAGDTGGASTGETSSSGAHDHDGAVSSEALTAAQMPEHHHSLRASSGGGISASGTITGGVGLLADYSGGHTAGPYVENLVSPAEPWVEDAGDGDPHAHDIASDGAHTHTFSALPPYCVLWFLMRKAA